MKTMPKILACTVTECAFNADAACHALAITVGDGGCPLCDTAIRSSERAGYVEARAGVGACKVWECKYNYALECTAPGIAVEKHREHAECGTFTER